MNLNASLKKINVTIGSEPKPERECNWMCLCVSLPSVDRAADSLPNRRQPRAQRGENAFNDFVQSTNRLSSHRSVQRFNEVPADSTERANAIAATIAPLLFSSFVPPLCRSKAVLVSSVCFSPSVARLNAPLSPNNPLITKHTKRQNRKGIDGEKNNRLDPRMYLGV